MSLPDLNGALDAWRALMGAASVWVDGPRLDRYRTCTTGASRRIPAALLVRSVDEVAPLVKIAHAHRVPIYPISTGHNWGYGTANPVLDGCVIVDLGALQGITEFDAELGLVTLEPGVTQGDLRAFLDAQNAPFLVPVTGAGPSCSIVGNALERGYGITPYADHFGAVMELEAVLPDGTIYRGAHTELGGRAIDRAYKWGLGAYLDGLFAQGAFGIVTRMTIALAPRPSQTAAVFFTLPRDDSALSAVNVVRAALTSIGGVMGSVNLMNQLRVLSMRSVRPDTPSTLSKQTIALLAREHAVAPWSGLAALYGEPDVVRAAAGHLKRLLKPLDAKVFVMTRARSEFAQRLLRRIPLLDRSQPGKLLRQVSSTLDILEGKPSEVALSLPYWRSGARPAQGALDPARDGCGLMWYAPLLPMKREAVASFVAMVEDICPRHGIDPLITLTTLSHRCFDATVPLLFDRATRSNAEACFQELFATGKTFGFLPYRVSAHAMHLVVQPGTAFWETTRKLKSALDPAQIMAPGRYVPMNSVADAD